MLALLLLVIGASLAVVAWWWSRRAAPPQELAGTRSPAATAAAPTGASAPGSNPPVPQGRGGQAQSASAVPQLVANPVPTPHPALNANPGKAAPAPLPQLDVAELLRARSSPGSPWPLAWLRGNPAVLVLQFPSLAEQGAAMNRIAALMEKAGAPRDRVLSDGDLHSLIARSGDNPQTFYQGHDYVAEQLARFFTLAEAQGQALNVHEMQLRELMLERGLITREGARYRAPSERAIVTFTATQPDDPKTPQDEAVDERRRESVLLHELSHGRYFTDRAYREHCWRFWRERLTDDERRAWRAFVGKLNYDVGNEDLVVNEMQALLMHTPDARAFNAKVLGVSEAQLADLRTRFTQGMPQR